MSLSRQAVDSSERAAAEKQVWIPGLGPGFHSSFFGCCKWLVFNEMVGPSRRLSNFSALSACYRSSQSCGPDSRAARWTLAPRSSSIGISDARRCGWCKGSPLACWARAPFKAGFRTIARGTTRERGCS